MTFPHQPGDRVVIGRLLWGQGSFGPQRAVCTHGDPGAHCSGNNFLWPQNQEDWRTNFPAEISGHVGSTTKQVVGDWSSQKKQKQKAQHFDTKIFLSLAWLSHKMFPRLHLSLEAPTFMSAGGQACRLSTCQEGPALPRTETLSHRCHRWAVWGPWLTF